MAAPRALQRDPSDDWGVFADLESDDEGPSSASSASSDQGHSSDPVSTRGSMSSSSTAGLTELNSWLYDSCEMGVAAWMRAGSSDHGRRRCYFTTGDDVRIGPPTGSPQRPAAPLSSSSSSDSGRPWSSSSEDEGTYRPRPARARDGSNHRPARGRRPGRSLPQQLWCVTPFEKRKVDAWSFLETALTPRLCPRVFSREFGDRRRRINGVIVGCSLGSIRVVRNAVTGLRRVEYLLMVSVGDRCRRSWRRHSDFATHARRFANRGSFAAPQTHAAWTVAECERRWLPCVEDYPYIASRHAAYEAVLREVLFHAEGPDELLQLAGASSVELPQRGSPAQSDSEELLFGVEVSDLSEAEEPTLTARVKHLILGGPASEPVAHSVPARRPSRLSFPSMSCLDGCGVSLGRSGSGEAPSPLQTPLQTALQTALVKNHRSKHFLSAVNVHTHVPFAPPPRVKTESSVTSMSSPQADARGLA